jgi:hypothetical protein
MLGLQKTATKPAAAETLAAETAVAADAQSATVDGPQTRDGVDAVHAHKAATAATLRYGNHKATIEAFGVVDADGEETTELVPAAPYRFFVQVRCRDSAVKTFNVGLSIRTVHGVEIFAVNPVVQRYSMPTVTAGDTVEVEVAFCNWLAPGDYFVTFGVWYVDSPTHYDRIVDALHLKVTGDCRLLAQSVVNLEAVYSARLLGAVQA